MKTQYIDGTEASVAKIPQKSNVAQGQSIGKRVNPSIFENEPCKAIINRCIQIKEIFVTLLAILFVLGVNLGVIILVAALSEALTFNELLAMFGLEKWLV